MRVKRLLYLIILSICCLTACGKQKSQNPIQNLNSKEIDLSEMVMYLKNSYGVTTDNVELLRFYSAYDGSMREVDGSELYTDTLYICQYKQSDQDQVEYVYLYRYSDYDYYTSDEDFYRYAGKFHVLDKGQVGNDYHLYELTGNNGLDTVDIILDKEQKIVRTIFVTNAWDYEQTTRVKFYEYDYENGYIKSEWESSGPMDEVLNMTFPRDQMYHHDYSYDEKGNLTQIEYRNSSGDTLINDNKFSYNDKGERISSEYKNHDSAEKYELFTSYERNSDGMVTYVKDTRADYEIEYGEDGLMIIHE